MGWQSIGRGECDHCGDTNVPVWDVSPTVPNQVWCLYCIEEKAS